MSAERSVPAPGSIATRLVALARLGRPRGLKGEISLHPVTDRPQDVLSKPGVYRLEDGRTIEVDEFLDRGGKFGWRIKGAPGPEALAPYVNAVVVADPAALPERGEGEYDEAEIIGCRVIDTLGRERGAIVRIDHRYEIDTWIVRTPRGEEGEIPAVAAFIQSVDVAERLVTVTPEAILL
jgi:16S rRNA processing protein RimM